MIYLDNAATTYPKPLAVQNAVRSAMVQFGANPGRSGHAMSIATAEAVYRCREEVAECFHAPGPECIAFTLNCTSALNFVIKGIVIFVFLLIITATIFLIYNAINMY